MNYNNITKENFKEYENDLYKTLSEYDDIRIKHQQFDDKNKTKTKLVDDNGNDYYETLFGSASINFIKLFEFSHKNNLYFLFCSSIVYENTFQDRFKEYESKFIDVKQIDFIKIEYIQIINKYFQFRNDIKWDEKCINLIQNTLEKKRDFLIRLLSDNNCKVVEVYNPSNYDCFDAEFITLNYSKEMKNAKHENIFCNNGFVLFEHILNNYVKKNRGRKTDISFFYWSMYNNNPQYIHQRPERFKEWFFENYNNEDLGKIKTYDQVNNIDRQKHFSNALDWFKSQP